MIISCDGNRGRAKKGFYDTLCMVPKKKVILFIIFSPEGAKYFRREEYHLDYRKAKITYFQKFQSRSGWCVKYHNKRNRSKYKLWKQSSGNHSRVTIQCDCFSCSKTSEKPMRTRPVTKWPWDFLLSTQNVVSKYRVKS